MILPRGVATARARGRDEGDVVLLAFSSDCVAFQGFLVNHHVVYVQV